MIIHTLLWWLLSLFLSSLHFCYFIRFLLPTVPQPRTGNQLKKTRTFSRASSKESHPFTLLPMDVCNWSWPTRERCTALHSLNSLLLDIGHTLLYWPGSSVSPMARFLQCLSPTRDGGRSFWRSPSQNGICAIEMIVSSSDFSVLMFI